MSTLKKVLLIAAVVVVVLVAGLATAFYVMIYRPIASPIMAMVGTQTLEARMLQNHGRFDPPASGALTPDQVARFLSVEEAVAGRLGASVAVFEEKRLELQQIGEIAAIPARRALPVFAVLKAPMMDAKVAQIDAMNQVNLSKQEFEWIRRELYRAAGVPFAQLDVSDVLSGEPDPVLNVRTSSAEGPVHPVSTDLARPLAEKLSAWRALAFFGL